MSPWVYHCSNLIYHLIASCLTFSLISRLQVSRQIAFFATTLFTLNPLVTQAVAWIPGRNDSLLTIFILASFIALIRSRAPDRGYLVIVHLLLFLFSLLTKETALVFPLLCLFYLHYLARIPILSREIATYVLGWLIVGSVWFFMRKLALGEIDRVYTLDTFIHNLRVVPELLGKIVIPLHLSGYPTFNTIPLIIGVAIASLIAFIFITQKDARNNVNMFALVWLIIFMLPSLVVHIGDSEHRFSYLESRAYISVVVLSLLVAGLFQCGVLKLNRSGVQLCVIASSLYAMVALNYSSNFRDSLTYWSHATRVSPKAADAYFSLGLAFMTSENLNHAVENYRKAVALDPTNFAYHNNLGIAYGQRRSLDQAETEFDKSIELNPSDPIAHSNLGFVYFLKNDFSESEKHLKEALALDPNYLDALRMLIGLYTYEKKYNEARIYSEKLQRLGMTLDPPGVKGGGPSGN